MEENLDITIKTSLEQTHFASLLDLDYMEVPLYE